MNFTHEPYNKIVEFQTDVLPALQKLQHELNKHGIHFVFAACTAQNHPVDGQDSISFVTNTGAPSTLYNNPQLINVFLMTQGKGILVTHPNALTHGVFIPTVLPPSPKSN